MSHRCIVADELESVRALPPGDPRRVEVEACPRCQALLGSYLEFMEDRSVPRAAEPGTAKARLGEAFERALAETTGADRSASGSHASPQRPERRAPAPPREKAAWWAPLFGPRLAWSAAAVLVVVVGVYAGARWQAGPHGDDVLRTDAGAGAGAGARERPVLQAPATSPAGLALRWTSVEGADAYRVVFLGDDLARLGEIGPLPDTVAVLESPRLPAGLTGGRTVAWQVEALQGGFVIASSETALITLP